MARVGEEFPFACPWVWWRHPTQRRRPAGAGSLRTGGSQAGEGQDGFVRVKSATGASRRTARTTARLAGPWPADRLGRAHLKPIPKLRKTSPTLSKPPLWPQGFEPRSNAAALCHVAHFAGARPAQRDEIDTRIVREAITSAARIIDSQDEVGGYPHPKPAFRRLDVPDRNRRNWLEDLTRSIVFSPIRSQP